MTQAEIQAKILQLADKKNALILAHNYQRDEIQEIAHITGDSLGLSIEAARTSKDVIVFCGVHFMAESAALLSPQKTVLLPRHDAGCPMADMVTPAELRKMKARYPQAVVVTYVNSSAAVKAESDICCTSSNAINVVRSLNCDEVLLVPDRNLGRYIARHVDKVCHVWEGYCPTHERLQVRDIETARRAHPDAVFIAHPECSPEILERADHICSTSGMYEYVANSSAATFIIGTEMGILHRLRTQNPHKKFIMPSKALICPNMKLTSLEDLLHCLETMRPRVTVAPETAEKARRALDRMLAVPRD
ncbi:MAG: quinolinate synthase NadA [Deltaproteobacteria bacterium]|nr:quinolinate synthase NadA [Deltaproteobacteria bacterium]NCP04155.1 quinolinate synthase NadA [Deltaproteobacteria bacterium]